MGIDPNTLTAKIMSKTGESREELYDKMRAAFPELSPVRTQSIVMAVMHMIRAEIASEFASIAERLVGNA
jgi:hypothetical protein